jgi:hypothetical protein
MNKREYRMRAIYEKNCKQDLSDFTLRQLIDRAKLQDYLYLGSWKRTERWLMSG